MAQIHTYDAAKHFLSFAGNLIAQGFGPDTFIKVSRASETFTHTKGASGEGARSKTNDNSGTVEVTLLSTSQANDTFAAIAAADELLGSGIGPLQLIEFGGTLVVNAQNAWIEKQPDLERAREVGTTTWIIRCDDLKIFAGGLL